MSQNFAQHLSLSTSKHQSNQANALEEKKKNTGVNKKKKNENLFKKATKQKQLEGTKRIKTTRKNKTYKYLFFNSRG